MASEGISTSEFKLAAVSMVVGTILEAFAGVLHTLQDTGTNPPWFTGVLVIVGALIQVASFLGYNKGRVLAKATSPVVAEAPPKP